jgi:uncharacterized membrane protein YgaE (UPF0421/DUF939 family)
MKIGFRTIKSAIGAGLAIFLSQLLQLDFPTSAAIITLLCVESTKKKSVQAALNRFFACIIALLLCSSLFELLGYTAFSFSLFVLLLLPFLVKFNIQKGFITSVVVSLHILSLEKVSLVIIENEFYLILVGVCVAMLLNSFMPNHEKTIIELKDKIERHFKKILLEFSIYLESGDQGWDGKEIVELPSLLEKSKTLAPHVSENNMLKDKQGYFYYFLVREKQFEILERMLPIISSLSKDIPQRHIFARFLSELSDSVSVQNTAHIQLEKLQNERRNMDGLPIPKTREEFITRASVIQLMNEMELYLKTKMRFYEKNGETIHKLYGQ